MDKGNIIFLNGPSSSGKTRISKTLQNVLDEPYLHVGLDHFLPMLARRFCGINPSVSDPARRGVYCDLSVDESTLQEFKRLRIEEKLSFQQTCDQLGISEQLRQKGIAIRFGPVGQRLISGMHHSIAALASSGNHMIVDHGLVERKWIEECVKILHRYNVLFVGVRCPLKILEQRERDRGDRPIGEARWSYDIVHTHGKYDMEVDTSISTVEDCALKIKERLENGPIPDAFGSLRIELVTDNA